MNDANKINEQVSKLIEKISLQMDLGIKNNIHEADAELNLLIIFTLLFLALLACLVIANKLVLSTPMANLADIIKSMASQQRETGSANVNTDHLNKDIKTELGAIAYWLSDLLSAINEQNLETTALANSNKRVKQALDACSTNVMMADPEFNIVYMNPAVQEMMKVAESDLKQELSNFDANNLDTVND